jgi:addiction module RelE/StbE family toxin
MYAIYFTSQARRIFKKLPKDIQDKLKNEARTLADNPLAGEQLHGSFRRYRSLHTSYKGVAYRIIYHIFSKTNSIIIVLADKRENLYKRLQEMKL